MTFFITSNIFLYETQIVHKIGIITYAFHTAKIC